MEVVGINHLLEFCNLEKGTTRSTVVPGDDDKIPESTWEFSFKKNKDGTWNLYLDLKNFEDFKTGQIFAVGFASLVLKYAYGTCRGGGPSRPLQSSKSAVKHCSVSLYAEDCKEGYDLRLTNLAYLRSSRIWSFENVKVKGSVDSYEVFRANLTLFLNKPPFPKIQSDFSDLLENGLHADVILVAERKEFKVHKSILSARSTVFKSMLEADMKEKNKEIKVDISNVKSGVVEKMLKFMYTGTYEYSGESGLLEELFTLAVKFGITDLKKNLAEKMCNGITIENVDKRFKLADQFDEIDLRGKCFYFKQDNNLFKY